MKVTWYQLSKLAIKERLNMEELILTARIQGWEIVLYGEEE